MNPEFIEGINRNLRVYIKARRDSALNSLRAAMNAKDIDGMDIKLMDSSQWIRVDFELLIRVVFWANLTDGELRARIVFDQRDMLQRIKNRLELKDKDNEEVNAILTDLEDRQKSLPHVNKIENNKDILNRIIWHRDNLKILYGAFYSGLSKLTHPDPYFAFMEEDFIRKEGENIIRSLDACAEGIDREWDDLEKESVK